MTPSQHDDPLDVTADSAAETHNSLEALSRRTVLQMTGGVAMMTAVPTATAQTVAQSSQQSVGQKVAVMTNVRLTINGEVRQLQLDPRQSLLDVLRETLGLTGTKKGCNQGACGACTVLVNGKRITSCLTLAVMHDGKEITTIEGLARGDNLHPVQAAFIEHDGFQCGYCTPGQIMSAVACIAEGHAGSPEEIKFWMSGNICRCGAYPGIVAAVTDAAGRG